MPNNEPLVSVIVPAYNAQDHLLGALECALTQDLRDIEVICVDDGSTDRSAEIVRALADVDPRLRLVQQPNGGAGAARNRGIDEARGRFVTFLDSDDWYQEKSYLRTLYEGAVANGVKAAGGCIVNWRGPGNEERDFSGTEYDGYAFGETRVIRWEDFQFDYGFHRFMFARVLFADGANRFCSLTYFEDPVFLVRVLADAGEFFATNGAHYLYRCGGAARFWTTRTALDLLEGVSRNLEFSREHHLPRLHWYTLWHMEWPVWEMGIGPNRALAVDVIDAKLQQVERLIDQDMMAEAGERRLPFVPRLRKAIDSYNRFDPAFGAYRQLRYAMVHRG